MQLFAHRGLPGRWQNSRRGVLEALELGYPGVEVDLVLTADGVPVLSHDPWLHPDLVRHADGRPLAERILVKDLDLARLRANYQFACPHPDHPGPPGDPEPPTTLDDVVALLAAHPGRALYLDVKLERPRAGLTASARRTARALFARLRPLGAHTALWIEGGSAAILARYAAEAGGLSYHPVLSYPRFDAGIDDNVEAVAEGLATRLGLSDPARRCQRADAAFFAAPRQIITRAEAEQAAERGRPGVLFGVDRPEQLAELRQWPLAGLIVDHGPGMLAA